MRGLPEDARCRRCGYRLRDLPAYRCPECATPFHPADRSSYVLPKARNLGGLRRMPIQPPSPFFLVILVAVCAVTSWSGASPERFMQLGGRQFTSSGLLISAIVGVELLRRYVLYRMFVARGWDAEVAEYRAARRVHVALIAALALALLSAKFPWPAVLRFYLSWSALEAEAQRYLAGAPEPPPPRRVGLWTFDSIGGRGQSFIMFRTKHDHVSEQYGILRYAGSGHLPWARLRIWIAPNWAFEAW